MFKVKLNNKNIYTTIDKDDFALISKHTWGLQSEGYVRTTITKNGKSVGLYLHRLIMNCPKGKCVDHINGDRLDSRKYHKEYSNPKGIKS